MMGDVALEIVIANFRSQHRLLSKEGSGFFWASIHSISKL